MARILLAIPVFNEAPYLSAVLARARRYMDEILVVDDASTDRTPLLLAREVGIHRLTHAHNQGYGQSLIDAFAFARRRGFDWVITMDCDEQHEPAYIPHFVEAIEADDADIISGSRYLRSLPGNGSPPPERRRINALITGLLNGALDLGLSDAFCGFKAHRVAATTALKLTVPGYAFPLQMWVRAARAGLRIREIPVPLIYNDPKRSFGGVLDDPSARLQHYLTVFVREMRDGRDESRPAAPIRAGRCQPCGQC